MKLLSLVLLSLVVGAEESDEVVDDAVVDADDNPFDLDEVGRLGNCGDARFCIAFSERAASPII